MRSTQRFGGPPWWSQPADGRPNPLWHRRRAHVVRRIRWLIGVLLLLSVIGAGAVGWVIAAALGAVRPGLPAAALAAVPLALLAMALAAAVLLLRRVATPFGDIMAAAGQIASGDYGIRVIERGPPAIRALTRSFNQMTERLAKHDEVRRNMMADIAHELRTPLTVVQGRLEGLLDGIYQRDDAAIEQALEETRVLARLVEDLRTLALSEAGALRLETEPTDVNVLIHDAVLSFDAQAQGAGLRVESNADANLPLIDLDPVRIGQVLRNLLANAIAHTPRGGRVDVSARPRGGGGVEVAVRDTGVGVSPEALPHMFERFEKGGASRGSGLGLTIARNLVLAHGGTIDADSEPGRGTTVRFTVPRTRPTSG